MSAEEPRAADMPVSFGDIARSRRKGPQCDPWRHGIAGQATITAAAANHVLQQGGLRG